MTGVESGDKKSPKVDVEALLNLCAEAERLPAAPKDTLVWFNAPGEPIVVLTTAYVRDLVSFLRASGKS